MKRPESVRGVILDVDGTIVDSNDAHAHAWVRASMPGATTSSTERIRPLIGMGGDKIIPRVTGLAAGSVSGRIVRSAAGRFSRRPTCRR